MAIEILSPAAAAALLAQPWPGASVDDTAVAQYREAMRQGRWMLNGMPIIVSASGVLLDGVQRLRASLAEELPLTSFVARDVPDDVLPIIDQHNRRSLRSILAARGSAHPQALIGLITRLLRYDDALAARATTNVPGWPDMERVLLASPGIEEVVAESLAMTHSPLPEALRTAILYLGLQHDRVRTLRLFEALRHPQRFQPEEPGAVLRAAVDLHRRVRPAARDALFTLALQALRATLDGTALSPDAPLPDLRGAPWPPLAPSAAVPAASPILTHELITPATAQAYLRNSATAGGLITPHLEALTRDIAAGRWMANPQPICLSTSGRLVNGRHRLMAVVAADRPIAVPVIRGVPEAAYATYDTRNKRPFQVGTAGRSFGDEALVAAMANLLWRREQRAPNSQARGATAAEISRILGDHPRLRELRGLARRLVGLGNASVMGYGAFVMERADPRAASVFLRALETGADLPRRHPILALRATLLRMRADGASQDEQLAALLEGWEQFRLHELAQNTPAQQSQRIPTTRDAPPARDAAAELARRRHQQAITATFARFVLDGPEEAALLHEAARAAAAGLHAPFSKVLQHEPGTDSLLLRAGMGWPAGVVGNTRFGLGADSPAGFAFSTGRSIVSDRIDGDQRFTLPPLLKAHGIIRQLNVVIGGAGAPFGVLEVDDNTPGRFDAADVSFLAALAGSLGLALERARERADHAAMLRARDAAFADLQHRMRNSLQLAHTVLTLQAAEAENEAARDILEHSAQRIITIAVVSERIEQASRQEAVELGAYLEALVAAVRDGLAGLAEGRSVALDAEAGTLPAERAQLLGIIMAELLINALQHGRGAVLVRFSQAPPAARLEVSAREPADAAMLAATAGGMRIAAALLREHGGALTQQRDALSLRMVAEFAWPGALP